MTDNKLAMPTMEDAAEKLKDKIKIGFAELIPDEQWVAMIKAEVEKFMSPSTRRDGYHGTVEVPSGFSKMCVNVFEELLSKKLNEDSAAWKSYMNDHVSVMVDTWIKEHGHDILKAYMDAQLAGALQNFANSIQFGR